MSHLVKKRILEIVMIVWLFTVLFMFIGYYIFFVILKSTIITIIFIIPYISISLCITRYTLLRYSCWQIQKIINKYGKLDYSPSKKPAFWHKKMHYLRIIEILTLKEERIKFYLFCGSNIGKNVVCDGYISDPDLVEIGDQTIIGTDSLILSHSIEGDKIILSKVKIGKNCTIGGRTIILPGCEIGNYVVIGCNSVVPKGLKIPPNSIWAGIPARSLKKSVTK